MVNGKYKYNYGDKILLSSISRYKKWFAWYEHTPKWYFQNCYGIITGRSELFTNYSITFINKHTGQQEMSMSWFEENELIPYQDHIKLPYR